MVLYCGLGRFVRLVLSLSFIMLIGSVEYSVLLVGVYIFIVKMYK